MSRDYGGRLPKATVEILGRSQGYSTRDRTGQENLDVVGLVHCQMICIHRFQTTINHLSTYYHYTQIIQALVSELGKNKNHTNVI